MADDLSLFGRAVEAGLRMYDKTQDRSKLPANKRVFLESTLDGVKTPITEKYLSKQEQQALKDLIVSRYEALKGPFAEYKKTLENKLAEDAKAIKEKNRDRMMYPAFKDQALKDLQAINSFFSGQLTPDFLELASGKNNYERSYFLSQAGLYNSKYGKTGTPFNVAPNIQYDDYSSKDNVYTSETGNNNPQASLRTLLGRFNYTVDPQNNIVIKDDYDFNPPTLKYGSQETNTELSGSPIYTALREYAGEKIPPGKGRPVNISVPIGTLQYRDPFEPTIK